MNGLKVALLLALIVLLSMMLGAVLTVGFYIITEFFVWGFMRKV